MAAAVVTAAFAGGVASQAQRAGDIGLTYTQERSKFSESFCQCFTLRGASVDFATSLFHGIGPVVAAQGLAVSNLRGSIDIHQITLMVGPRYTRNFGRIDPVLDNRRLGVFIDGRIGYTFATAGLYPVNGALADHASGLTYQGGGGLNWNIYHRFELRLIEADYVRTQLPNGGTNEEDAVRLAAGINVHLGR